MAISLVTSSNRIENLPIGFLAVSLGLNYLLMLYFGAKLRRYKAWLYPLMFILTPVLNWVYMVYGIFTAGQRTWGGPRADAAAADMHTNPEEAAEQARVLGNDLNVDVDTFRATRSEERGVPVRPAGNIEGRFRAATQSPSRDLHHQPSTRDEKPNITVDGTTSPLPGVPRIHPYPRCSSSSSSVFTTDSANPVSMPHSVESLMTAEEQVRLYLSRKPPPPQESVTSMEVFADANDHSDPSDIFESPPRGDGSLDEADIGNSKPQLEPEQGSEQDEEPPENMV